MNSGTLNNLQIPVQIAFSPSTGPTSQFVKDLWKTNVPYRFCNGGDPNGVFQWQVDLKNLDLVLNEETSSHIITEGKRLLLVDELALAKSALEEEKTRGNRLSQSLERYVGITWLILTLRSLPSVGLFVVCSANGIYFHLFSYCSASCDVYCSLTCRVLDLAVCSIKRQSQTNCFRRRKTF